jgi:hypothetical protein
MVTSSDPPPPSLPGFPADQPIPTDPIEGLTLEQYAAISAELNERREPTEGVLLRHGLDLARWQRVEQTWPLRIAALALRGNPTLAQDYDRYYVAAQDALGPTEPTRTLDEYARITGRILSGEEAAQVSSSEGLSLADFARLVRAWNTRLARDPDLTKAFRALVQTHKQR